MYVNLVNMAPVVTIPKKVSGGEELFVIQKREFEAFRRWRTEANDALAKVKRGREEYKRKKTITAITASCLNL